ncbi:phosphotransferase [Paenibacillus sp. MER 78]|nr:phosphotransferase [Paenibacillus sp. MER 78]
MSELYSIGEVKECRFLVNGLNDTYVVKTSSIQYVLRIYKAHWRTKADILFELELLNDLKFKGISVSSPVPTKDSDYLYDLQAPEGLRHMVLFTYADGEYSEDEDKSEIFGEEVARMHLVMDHFRSEHARFEIDLNHLLNEPLQNIRPFLSHRPEDFNYLEALTVELRSRIEEISNDIEWGICHGDLHGGNVHFHENTLTQFDFDCCGYGYRSYDVSVYLWNKVMFKDKDAFENKNWTLFIHSYQKIKPPSSTEIRAVPIFVATRDIWLMGLTELV